ncbi:MAG: hypothetical protein AAGA87_09530 [Pseudomonadota bacterium]
MTYGSNVVFGPEPQIETVIRRYGAWPVLTAAALSLIQSRLPRPPTCRAEGLPDYLREDVGLPALGAPPRLNIYY